MASWRPKRCRVCGAKRADGVQISKRGYCWSCGRAAFIAAITSMHGKTGETYDRWAATNGPAGRSVAGKGGVGIPPPVVKPASIERASRVQA